MLFFYREPDTSQNQKLNVATIKELTGGKEINARLNYSNNTKCNLKATHILEWNERPKLSGKIDDAVVHRLIDIHVCLCVLCHVCIVYGVCVVCWCVGVLV